jgi:hypothetical protein
MHRNSVRLYRSRALCAQTIFFTLWTSLAFAGNATIAIPLSSKDDPFVQSLLGSGHLKDANINLSLLFGSEQENVEKVLSGKADLALVDVDAFKNRKGKDEPLLISFFSQPFLFTDARQVYSVQDAALGTAALSDISRIGLVGLAYWNKGESQLVTKEKLFSADAIKQLKIGSYGDDNTAWVLTKLGASNQTLRPENVSSALNSGSINAAIVNQPTENFFRKIGPTFVASIRPLVGVLVANASYWGQLHETEKRAWQRTAYSANTIARTGMEAKAKDISGWVTFEEIPLPEGKAKADIISTGPSDSSYVSYQLNLVNEALNASVKKKVKTQQ